MELREVVTGMYGAATAGAIFAGPTPQDPVVLSRFAGNDPDRFAALRGACLRASIQSTFRTTIMIDRGRAKLTLSDPALAPGKMLNSWGARRRVSP